ncbi:ribonuclease Y [Peredibacter starrii]|uniref:Ribonuclease Y n=1 Tax=Peredibacter starrii TaxID=28202 RepID=A0AAX4HQY9_9BACT|nr:ribonuclease Y [Peredibacter starrii]WPU65666.1 ribonuclease Y [Peredibacter starrii]
MNPMMMAVVGVIVGAIVAYLAVSMKNASAQKSKEGAAQDILAKAQADAEEVKKKAEEKAKQIVRDERNRLEDEMEKKKKHLSDFERGLTKKEVALEQKTEQIQKDTDRVKAKETEIETRVQKLDAEIKKNIEIQDDLANKLTQVAGLTKEQAKNELIAQVEEEARLDAAKKVKRIEEEANEEAEKRSKRIVGIAIQRFAGEYVAEQTISSVEIADDGVKGRLIGREGRNIRAFEQICGVDLIIDDTPGVVTISSFNVVRKEISRMTIERLIADGRIHPAKIEEFYEKCKHEFESRLRELGEKAQMEIGVHGIHPEILKLIGALNWRTSYTQNQYQHALETAFLAGNMAAELGMNVKQARRAGLMHDIGKVLDASAEGSHAVIGADFAKKYGESPDIVHAIRAHHDDEKPESVLAHLVAAGDALSGARPGARKALKESYVSRLSDIEKIVNGFEGVQRSYAISAGREIRVMVENEKVSDEQTIMLSRDIARKIEQEMSYPGTIKVSVIRETRAVGIAK